MPDQSINEAFDANQESLMALPGVVAVGIGEDSGRPCIVVLVESSDPAIRSGIPGQLDGYAVVVDDSGQITAFGAG
ncbi:MAG: hypothetical protein HOC77_04930 [Chloroflexi bacterium]|jgi:hypothetical protein|nr:hypothetical protein [Chloroflexota bacterium]MBT4073129.1 hypothetical protein [Chloroflexota bacterium]MBT4514422.1 hypothetical protein [Chloroflexota bacterium]MBT6682818.1 hypothetical protein [Chloroflexota bacterium]